MRAAFNCTRAKSGLASGQRFRSLLMSNENGNHAARPGTALVLALNPQRATMPKRLKRLKAAVCPTMADKTVASNAGPPSSWIPPPNQPKQAMQRVEIDVLQAQPPGNYPPCWKARADLLLRAHAYQDARAGQSISPRQPSRSNDPDIWYLAAENPRAGRQYSFGVPPGPGQKLLSCSPSATLSRPAKH